MRQPLQHEDISPEAHNGRGNGLLGQKRFDEAIASYDKAITLKPGYPQAYNNRGNAFQGLGCFEEAVANYRQAVMLKPDYAQAYSNCGNALKALRRFGEAIASYDKAIALKPDYATAYSNRGTALRELKRFDEALESYEKAIALLPGQAELYGNRGNAFQGLKRFDEAVASYDVALALKPDYAEAYSNRGSALRELKRFDEALASFDRAISLRPGYAEAFWNRALLYLLLGRFDIGWRDYEARKHTREPVGNRMFAAPLWLGDAGISGKTILVHWEQGLGDAIQFSRYLKLLEEAGATVFFAPQKSLRELMGGLEAKVHIVDIDDPTLRFDFHCPLMSLPLAFETDVTTIPGAGYISADKEKIAAWGHRLGRRTRPRIGVVWSGSAVPDPGRSIELRHFMRLFDNPYEFISLQKEVKDTDRTWLNHAPISHFGDALDDFSDTAALCSLMDLVISIDTSVAHLAGALGGPVWGLLSWLPDWRWMLDRNDSPWYPSMRLFRQQARGDWDGVLLRAGQELVARFG